MSLAEFRKRSTPQTVASTGGLASFRQRKKQALKGDLTTAEGLYDVAQQTGGNVAQQADKVMGTAPSLTSRVTGGLKKGLGKTLDVISRSNYAIASAAKNVIDNDSKTTLAGGLKSGITGKTKHTFSDVFEEAGWKPTSYAGKFGKGVAGFAADVLLDPTTYVTFGAGAGAKVAVAGATKSLSKEGTKLLAKGVAQKAGQEFGEDFVKTAIGRMAEKSPELYAKFIDQGGVKFFGQTLVSGGRIAGLVKAIPGVETTAKAVGSATEPARNTLYALFNRDASAKFGKLPNEYIQLQQKFRDLGQVKSTEALNGVVDIAKANNLTAQEAEMITNAIESKLPLSDARLENARKLLEQGLGRNLKAEQKAGINVGELPNYVPHMLLDEPTKNIPFKPTGVRVSLGATKGRTIEGTVAEINSAFGKDFFDPNIINTAAIRSVASARAVASKEFLTEVAQKFGTKAANAPTGYVPAGAKELEGLVFHPAIAEQIDKMGKVFTGDDATNNLLAAFDKAQNLWKASVTSIFPAFHGRNAISNVFLNYLDLGKAALSPAKHALSGVLLNNNRQATNLEQAILKGGDAAVTAKAQLKELLDKTVLTDDFGKTWTFGALRKEIKDRRVAFGDEFTGFLDIREGIQEKLKTAVTGKDKLKGAVRKVNPLSQENVAFKAGRALGNTIEQQARVLNFITNLEKTGDVVTAAERTKQFLFDYTNLSDFEKNVMRRLVPFYTFTRKNLELQVEQALKQPGKLATQAKLFTNISKTLSGGTLTEDEAKKLPGFLQEGLGIVYKRKGNQVEIINSIGTPIEQIFSTLKPNVLLGSVTPIAAVPLQIAIGKHFFFDKDLKDVDDAKAFKNAPQFIKDYIGFTVRKNKDGTNRYVALDPTRLFIINNIPPSSRVVSVIGQIEDENVSGKLKILRQLTGLKPYGADLDLQAQYQEKAKMRELQDLLDAAGVAPILKRSFIPKQE